jgi:hypothetical protein
MAIYCITGKPRNGKTYYLATQILRWIKNGERVYSNVWVNLKSPLFKRYFKKYNLSSESIKGDLEKPEDLLDPDKQLFYWSNMRDWNKMTKGVIVCDEGTRYFNPRRWSLLSEDTEIKLQQHGKDDLDVWLTTQHYTRLDVTLRILVESFFDCEKIFGSSSGTGIRGKPFGIIRIREHYLEDMERVDRAVLPEDIRPLTISSKFIFIKKKYCDLYNTLQKVGRGDPMLLTHEERRCDYIYPADYFDKKLAGKPCGKTHITHS